MVFHQLNSVRSLSRFIAKNRALALACGVEQRLPCYRTLTRRFKTLDTPAIVLTRQVIQVLVRYRVISLRITAIDSSLLEASGKPAQKRNPTLKSSDPDAAWGWSASRDWIFGYKLHITTTVLVKKKTRIRQTLVPLAWEISAANHHDTHYLIPLLDRAVEIASECHRKIRQALADKGYDSQENYRGCKQRNCRLIAPPREMRTRTGKPVKLSRMKRAVTRFLKTKKGKQLYYRRADAERLLGHLKSSPTQRLEESA